MFVSHILKSVRNAITRANAKQWKGSKGSKEPKEPKELKESKELKDDDLASVGVTARHIVLFV